VFCTFFTQKMTNSDIKRQKSFPRLLRQCCMPVFNITQASTNNIGRGEREGGAIIVALVFMTGPKSHNVSKILNPFSRDCRDGGKTSSHKRTIQVALFYYDVTSKQIYCLIGDRASLD